MFRNKLAFLATTALVGNAVVAGAAVAQSTGTQAAEVIVVTGSAGPPSAGVAVAQTVDKTRSTIDQDTIERQNPGQTILQTLNLAPGLNFTNSDPYGNSGGNIRLRGFDGNRVGLAFDGVPLNDTGNYATFTNQQLDPELITQASVNQGTTDVDSPTAAAIGGIINYVSARPEADPTLAFTGTIGENEYNRTFLRADTGEFGPWGTSAYVSGSHTRYEKFKGPGTLDKQQYNAKIYQELGGRNFVAVAAHYNRNRNNQYNNLVNLAQFNTKTYLENDKACLRPTPVNGTVQDDATQSAVIRSNGTIGLNTSCTNYAGIRINPSDTGNLRVNFSYELFDGLRLTLDPSFQYVMANGGGFTTVSERLDRIDLNTANNATLTAGSSCLANAAVYQTGIDINGDGDSCDNVMLYTPSNTNTRRYGILGSLIWDLNDTNRFRLSYTNDTGLHRQTGEGAKVNISGEPAEVFAGKESWGDPGLRTGGVGGTFYRTRDRYSHAILNQFSLDWRGEFFDDLLTVSAGVRQPVFERKLEQYCYTANGTSNVLCTPQTPATTLANGNVTFGGDAGATAYVAPFSTKFKYDKVLPNVSAGLHFGDWSTYGSYSEQIAVPRTDNLYTVSRPNGTTVQPIAYNDVDPEFSKNYELGLRFTNNDVVFSAAYFLNQYSNRVVSTLDNDPSSPTFNTTIDRNVGKVESKGIEASVGWEVMDNFSIYSSVTLLDATLQEDQVVGSFTCATVAPFTAGCTPATAGQRYALILPTKGKSVVETPDTMFSMRADYEVTEDLSFGLQGKYVSERYTTDVNDEVLPSYTTYDFDARYDLSKVVNIKDAYLQFNWTNLTGAKYPINISSGTNAVTIADVNPDPNIINSRAGAVRTFGISAPRTMILTLGGKF